MVGQSQLVQGARPPSWRATFRARCCLWGPELPHRDHSAQRERTVLGEGWLSPAPPVVPWLHPLCGLWRGEVQGLEEGAPPREPAPRSGRLLGQNCASWPLSQGGGGGAVGQLDSFPQNRTLPPLFPSQGMSGGPGWGAGPCSRVLGAPGACMALPAHAPRLARWPLLRSRPRPTSEGNSVLHGPPAWVLFSLLKTLQCPLAICAGSVGGVGCACVAVTVSRTVSSCRSERRARDHRCQRPPRLPATTLPSQVWGHALPVVVTQGGPPRGDKCPALR